jgi:hypothetical protein
MFRIWNFQSQFDPTDPNNVNWKLLTDNTKSGTYTPLLTNITGTGVTITGHWTLYGPWVFVRIYVSTTSGNFTTTASNGFITLPTSVLVGTTSAIPQYLPITRTDNTYISGILTNTNSTNTIGQVQVNNAFFSNVTTLLYISGTYLRN